MFPGILVVYSVYRSANKQNLDWVIVYPVSNQTQVYRKTLSNNVKYGYSEYLEAEHSWKIFGALDYSFKNIILSIFRTISNNVLD